MVNRWSVAAGVTLAFFVLVLIVEQSMTNMQAAAILCAVLLALALAEVLLIEKVSGRQAS